MNHRPLARRGVLLAAACFAACFAACHAPPPVTPKAPDPVQPVAPIPAPTQAVAESTLTKLDNGLSVSITKARAGAMTQVQLGLFAGSLFVAPGLAELAAQMLVLGTDVSRGRLSLTQAIANLGGTLQVEVGPLTTWITMRVPTNRWPEAQAALRTALAAPALSRNQIERIRDDLVGARCAAIRTEPTLAMARALLLGESGTASYINSLLDRDPGEIAFYQSRMFRPDRAILALESQGEPAQLTKVLNRAEQGMAAWTPATAEAGATKLLERRFQPGLYWAPGKSGDMCHAAIVLYLPDLARGDAADLLLLHACVTLDGAGGRLEQMQRDRGLGLVRWRSDVVQTTDAIAIVLSADVTTTQATELWRILQRARNSLRDVPPTRSELELARRRATLTSRLGEVDATSRLRNRTSLLLRGGTMARLDKRLAELEQPTAQPTPSTTEAYLELPAAMVVIGGELPSTVTEVHRFELLPAAMATPSSQPDPTTQAAAATPWLDQAVEAAGGPELLRQFAGFEADGRLTNDRAPTAVDHSSWNIDGTFVRTRELLGTKIVTNLKAGAWSEQLGTGKQSLNSREAELLRREMERHPMALLAAYARGALAFRPIAQRNVGDRDLMVLEAIGDHFDRLRVHIDTDSHLVRVVEVWETVVDGSIVHLEDAWSDYRSTHGLRAPFRRITTQDDGQNRVETIYERWVPLLTRR